MKSKFLIFLLTISLLVGCSLSNTPTSKVESFLMDYQMLEDNVEINYMDIVSDVNISDEIRDKYEEFIRKQYRNLSYEIKDEKIDGDKAVVSVQIKVADYRSIVDKHKVENYSFERYHSLVIEDMEDVEESVIYTIDFEVVKDQYGTWNLQELSDIDKSKLLGMN